MINDDVTNKFGKASSSKLPRNAVASQKSKNRCRLFVRSSARLLDH